MPISIDQTPKIRAAKLNDIEGLMHLKNAEGWNQIERDFELLLSYPDSINLLATIDEKIIGSVTAINYKNDVAWIGMMLVAKNFRGRGISKLLLNSCINELKDVVSIKLDATPSGFPVYLKLGFKEELTICRMTNPLVSVFPDVNNSPYAEPIQKNDIQEIIAFDENTFGANRGELIRHLYSENPKLAWQVREDGEISGFCLGRKGTKYTQIGPLLASSQKTAKTLLCSALKELKVHPCVIDIHEDKDNIIKWLSYAGFEKQRSFERMYLNQNDKPGLIPYQYLIAGPELG